MMWFVAGLTLALATLWTWTSWRAEALPGTEESTIVNVTPERVLDSRNPVNLGLDGPFVSQVSQKLQITGSIPTATGNKTVVPAGATGVLLNVTAFNPSANGFVSIRPGDAVGAPTTSSLNVLAGQTVPNSVQVSLPTAGANAGKIDITYDALGQVGPSTDMFIDVVGYTTNTGLQEINTAINDRYTKAEINAFFKPYHATINNDGTVFMGYSSGLVSSTRTSTGNYTLKWDKDIETPKCVSVANDWLFGLTREVSSDVNFGNNDEVVVVIRDVNTGTVVDSTFNIIISCDPTVTTRAAGPGDDGSHLNPIGD